MSTKKKISDIDKAIEEISQGVAPTRDGVAEDEVMRAVLRRVLIVG